jgi:dTDP-4-amino-4,6-dideoxy-D-galactose acyltransferase
VVDEGRTTKRSEVREMDWCQLTSRGDVRSVMLDSVPWSPLDFIRGISTDGDRAVHVDALLRAMDPADDLRIASTISADREVAVCAERLAWDSSFFGYGVARLQGIFPLRGGYCASADYAPAIDALVTLARERGIRYLFGVIDARDLPTIRGLTASNFALIETRVYLHCPLRKYHYPRRFQCRLATGADIESLTALAETIENPFDRFNADPFIAKADTKRLMVTWIRASVLHGFADATFVPDSPRPAAVCTLKYHADKAATWNKSIGQLVLAMAAPRTGGWLVGMVSEMNYHLKERGYDHAFFSTQVTNRPTIRASESLGYRFGKCEYVFRLLL